MPDPVDVYTDQFQVSTGPFGCVLNFLITSHEPIAQGAMPPHPGRVATLRMSLEHLKVMTFILHRQVTTHERNSGARIPLPQAILNGLRIGREDWDKFWGEGDT